jgi:hypothetical protein
MISWRKLAILSKEGRPLKDAKIRNVAADS